jgi:hypothetical protein
MFLRAAHFGTSYADSKSMLDQRGQLLRSALGFAGCSLPSYDRALWALSTWLDSWPGIGHAGELLE